MKSRLKCQPRFLDKYRKFTTQAADHAAHNGYDALHRQLDADMVKWLTTNKNATKNKS